MPTARAHGRPRRNCAFPRPARTRRSRPDFPCKIPIADIDVRIVRNSNPVFLLASAPYDGRSFSVRGHAMSSQPVTASRAEPDAALRHRIDDALDHALADERMVGAVVLVAR